MFPKCILSLFTDSTYAQGNPSIFFKSFLSDPGHSGKCSQCCASCPKKGIGTEETRHWPPSNQLKRRELVLCCLKNWGRWTENETKNMVLNLWCYVSKDKLRTFQEYRMFSCKSWRVSYFANWLSFIKGVSHCEIRHSKLSRRPQG